MLGPESRLTVIDSSGVLGAKYIRMIGYPNKQYGRAGDIVACSILKRSPRAQSLRSRVHLGFIVGTVKKTKNTPGFCISCSYNGVFLLNRDSKSGLTPLVHRIKGPVSTNVRKTRYGNKVVLPKVRRLF